MSLEQRPGLSPVRAGLSPVRADLGTDSAWEDLASSSILMATQWPILEELQLFSLIPVTGLLQMVSRPRPRWMQLGLQLLDAVLG